MPQRHWGNWGQVAYYHMQSAPIACEVLQEGEGNVWPGPFSLPRSHGAAADALQPTLLMSLRLAGAAERQRYMAFI